MGKPKISKNFTIEDIHKIREYYSKKINKMKFEDFSKEISREARKVENDIEKLRKEKATN